VRVTTKVVFDTESWVPLYRESYDYVGPVAKCCSAGDQTAKDIEETQLATAKTLTADYSQSYAEQQSLLQSQQAKLNAILANPLGYSPQELAAAKTAINENTATAAKQAIGAAGAYAAAHGGADVGSGAAGEIAGAIGSAATQSKAQQLSALSEQNQAMKRQNYWNAISGLSNVGAQFGGAAGTSISGANSAANSAVNAGDLALQSSQAGWGDVGSIISGVAGLGTAGVGAYTSLAKLGTPSGGTQGPFVYG
jgi:hypothetical protein